MTHVWPFLKYFHINQELQFTIYREVNTKIWKTISGLVNANWTNLTNDYHLKALNIKLDIWLICKVIEYKLIFDKKKVLSASNPLKGFGQVYSWDVEIGNFGTSFSVKHRNKNKIW